MALEFNDPSNFDGRFYVDAAGKKHVYSRVYEIKRKSCDNAPVEEPLTQKDRAALWVLRNHRDAVIAYLRAEQGLTFERIGRILKMNRSTAKRRYDNLRAELRKWWKAYEPPSTQKDTGHESG